MFYSSGVNLYYSTEEKYKMNNSFDCINQNNNIININEDEECGQNNYNVNEKKNIINTNRTKIYEKTNLTTGIEPEPDKNSLAKNNEILNNKMPNYYPLKYLTEKYEDILKELSLNISEKDEKLENAENEMLLKIKRKIKIEDDYYSYDEVIEDNQNKNKKGRKRKDDNSQRKHNEFSSDNIMKKIKRILYKYLLIFINEIIKECIRETENIIIIEPLDNKCILDLKIKENRIYLNQTIKELLSDVKNKNNIKILLKKESNNEVLNYVFNLKFKEWIEIITLKKDIKCFGDISNDSYEVIKNHLPTIQYIIKDISTSNNKNDYLSLFFFYLINFERWFYIKNPKDNKKK